MKKLLLLPTLALGMLLLTECSPKTGKSTTVSASTTKTETYHTEAQIAAGKTIYTSNCNRCHKLVNPADKSLKKWDAVLPVMIHKAKLSDEQGELVRAYVMASIQK